MATLTPLPKFQAFTNNGEPLTGGKLYTYAAGTTTPLTSYTDSSGLVANSNPVILDSRGEASIWLGSAPYKLKLTTADNVEIWTVDNIQVIDQLTLAALETAIKAYYSASSGSSHVGFIQAGDNAVARTAQAKMRDIFCVKDFGAVGDNVNDDTNAFNYALAAILANGGGTLYVPTGVYKITSQLVYNASGQQHLCIRGDGRYVSTLNFRSASSLGILFNSTSLSDNQLPTFEVRDLGVITTRSNAGTALNFQYVNSNNIDASFYVADVLIAQNVDQISDSGSGYGYWSTGVRANNARNGEIRNLHAYGEMNIAPNSAYGVILTGESTAVVITDSLFLEWTTGIESTGTSEGTYVAQTDVIYCRYGIRHYSSVGAQPQLTVTGCSVNASDVGVWLYNSQVSVISDTVFFAASVLDSGPWPEFTGVLVQGSLSRYNRIVNCAFSKEIQRTGDVCNGIDFNEGNWGTAVGNHFFGFSGNQFTNGIVARSGVTRVACDQTNMFENVTNPYVFSATAQAMQSQMVISGSGTYANGDSVAFGQVFATNPVVVVTHAGSNTSVIITVSNIDTDSFVVFHNTPGSIAVNWVAVGRAY